MPGYFSRNRWTQSAKIAAVFISCSLAVCPQNTNNSPFSPSTGTTQAPVTLTLKDAIGLAEHNDPTVLLAASDATIAHEDLRQTREALLPSLSGRSEYLGTQGNGKVPSGRFVTNDGVHVYRDWAVVHGEIAPRTLTRSGVQRSSALEALSRARLEITRRGLAATVTKNYYALIVSQRKYVTAQTAVDQAHHSLEITQDLERGREVAHSDVLRSEFQENTQQQALQEARFAMESARLDLAVLLFRNFNENFSVIDDLDAAPSLPALNQAESMASRSNPTMASAIATLRGASLDVTIAREAFLPIFSVDAVYGIEANAFALRSTVAASPFAGTVPNLGYFVTASLNIPIWDWGIRRSKLKQTELKREQAEVDLSATQRTLVRNLRGYYDEAQLARQQIDVERHAVDIASEGLRLNTLRYNAGEATIIDLVDAQTNVVQARNAYSDGLIRYRLALSNLQTLTGTF